MATGPSLTPDDVEFCRGKAPVIVVNDGYLLAPWADALWATDCSWWLHHQGVTGFKGEKWSIEHPSWRNARDRWPDVRRLRNSGSDGIETDPSSIRHGKNSGYAAINLAVHYGAAKVILLGYDLGHGKNQPAHFFGEHRWSKQRSPYPTFLEKYRTAVEPLKQIGIDVVNCTRVTALTCFRRSTLAQELA